MIDLLLVEAPHGSLSEEKVDVPPLGLGYIAAFCEREGFTSRILDLNIKQANLEKEISNAEIVGVSCYTHNYHHALRILRAAKEQGKKVVIGGPHATPLYKEVLMDGFDYVIRGEGEIPMLNLLKKTGEMSGLAYIDGGVPKANHVSRIKDIDTLPYPARDLMKLDRYSFPGAIATTRGCASHCIYCSSRNQLGGLRMRGVESLRSELESLIKRRLNSFFVIDPNFAFDRARTVSFCDMVRPFDMEWYTELRLDHMDTRLIEAMASSGCRVVRFGIESGSQGILNFIRKGISLKNLERTLGDFRDRGIIPVCGFMIGHPGETKADFEMTLKVMKKIVKLGGESTLSIQTPYPGTYLYKNAEKLGIKILTRNWSEYHHLNPVMETENFTADDLRRALFDVIVKITGKNLPNIHLDENQGAAVKKIADGIERKSFRSICLETRSKPKNI